MNITVNLPNDAVERLKRQAAHSGHKTLEEYLQSLLASDSENRTAFADDELIDTQYLKECAKEADPTVTIESVRAALAKIPGSMTQDFIAERDEW